MNKPILRAVAFISFTVVSASATAVTTIAPLAPQGVSTATSAKYGNLTATPHSMTDTIPGSAVSVSRAGPGGLALDLGGTPSYVEAIAMARSSMPGTLGSYSHSGGWGPTDGEPSVLTSAKAASLTHWKVVSNDLSITTADISVSASFDGSLVIGNYAGASAIDTVASVTANIKATQRSQLYNETMTATLNGDGLLAAGVWANDSIRGGADGSVSKSFVDFNHDFINAFTVNVNETFSLGASLETSAYVVGPFELWAIADFYNTGEFSLSTGTAGVSLVQVPAAVPLPASLWFFCASLLSLVGRFRKRV